MRILVTGGAGYIGSHTIIELAQEGHDVVVVDNLCNSSIESIKRAEKIAGASFDMHQIDCSDKAALSSVFDQQKIDAVIHFAGLKAVGESVSQPLRYYRTNIDATLTLCEVMQEHGVKRLIFSSSATVYGEPSELPLRETSRTGIGITNPYGRTKYMIEQILQDLAAADTSWRITSLRYFNPVGAHESGSIGEDPNGPPNNLLPFITQVAAGRREKLAVFGNDYDTPDGTGVRDYIHVVDLAKGHLASLNHPPHDNNVDVYNLGTGKGVSVLEMVRMIEDVSGKHVAYEVVARRPGDLATCYADPSKANQQLGWRAEKTIEQACADAWRWQSQNPDGYNN
jgi:UDP-glucose 4-epimerase